MSLGNSRYGIDWMARAIELTSSNNQIVIDDGGATQIVSIATGTYWQHFDITENSGDHPSLYTAIATALNASGLSGTYAFRLITPSGSSLTNSGLRLIRTDSTGTFTVYFSHASFTLDPRLLGWGESPGTQTSTAHDDDGDNTDDSEILDAPYSIYGTWQSPHAAHDKRDTRHQTVVSSSDDPVNAYRNAWRGHRRRRMHYRFLPAGHVRRWAAEDSTIASDAGLPTGDVNNAFADFMWDASVSNEDILVVYDDGDQDLQVDSHTGLYEYVRFASTDEVQSVMRMIEDVPRGEEYDLTWHFASRLTDPEYRDP